jgi:hypothetical protein
MHPRRERVVRERAPRSDLGRRRDPDDELLPSHGELVTRIDERLALERLPVQVHGRVVSGGEEQIRAVPAHGERDVGHTGFVDRQVGARRAPDGETPARRQVVYLVRPGASDDDERRA